MSAQITLENLSRLMIDALCHHKTSNANATSVARALVSAEAQGLGGHGLSRLHAYCGQAASGKVQGFATPTASRISPSLIKIDAGNGFAYPAIDLAIESCTASARENAIGCALIGNSHHFGAAGLAAEKIAGAGQIAIMTGNSPKAIAPAGGNEPMFGTNPIAFAAPRRNLPPLVIDLSLSTVARGKVMVAAQRGEPIPTGWARDAEGKPTTDAQAGLDGSMEAIGGAKGAMLAMMIEILVAGLTSSNFGYEATSFFTAEGAPPCTAQMLIVIDPQRAGAGNFDQRLESLLSAMLEQPGVRLPGSRRADLLAAAERDGVTISDDAYQQLLELAQTDLPN
jgi:(2R)-3-sulfolactate dehydrogenase (NADP+)